MDGLGALSRRGRKEGRISNRVSRKLCKVDECFALLRHITQASASQMLLDLRSEFQHVHTKHTTESSCPPLPDAGIFVMSSLLSPPLDVHEVVTSDDARTCSLFPVTWFDKLDKQVVVKHANDGDVVDAQGHRVPEP